MIHAGCIVKRDKFSKAQKNFYSTVRIKDLGKLNVVTIYN